MTDHQKCQYLVKLFIKSNIKPNFALEIKVAKGLIKEFPEIEFWEELVCCHGKLSSLIFFKHKYRYAQLVEEYKVFNIRKTLEASIIEEQKRNEKEIENIKNKISNLVETKKNKNLFNFIDSQ